MGDEPSYAALLGAMGATSAVVFSGIGAAYGTAKAGSSLGDMKVGRVMSIIPVFMAGVLGIYGIVVAILIAGTIGVNYTLFNGYMHLAAGLAVGLTGLGSGYAVGVVGDVYVRGTDHQPRQWIVGMIFILMLAEAIGFYGLIVAIYLHTKTS